MIKTINGIINNKLAAKLINVHINRLIKSIIVLLFTMLSAQTIEYFPNSFYGNFLGTAGAGLAIINGASAIQLNPAGILNETNNEVLILIDGKYYSYHLLNYLHNRKVGRTFYQNNIKPVYPSLSFKSHINEKLGYGIGFTNYLTPFLKNSKRAVTWSPLYNQTTKGVIYSAIFGLCYRLNSNLQIGLNITRNWGTVSSSIEGENHYTDLGKTLGLKTKLSGWQMDFGAQLNLNVIDVGMNITAPQEFITSVTHTISQDSLYYDLIPRETHPKLRYPFNIGVGFATKFFDNWKYIFDIKTYNISDFELSFNIYDYGDKYKWQDGVGFNLGVIYASINNEKTLYKFGYAYVPQVRTIHDITDSKDLFGIINSGQNVKHIFTVGSQTTISNIIFDYGASYSFLKWHRNYSFGDWIIEDDYTQQELGLFVNVLYQSN